LNAVIERHSLHDDVSLARLDLPNFAEALLLRRDQAALSTAERQRLNRALLELSFPYEIGPNTWGVDDMADTAFERWLAWLADEIGNVDLRMRRLYERQEGALLSFVAGMIAVALVSGALGIVAAIQGASEPLLWWVFLGFGAAWCLWWGLLTTLRRWPGHWGGVCVASAIVASQSAMRSAGRKTSIYGAMLMPLVGSIGLDWLVRFTVRRWRAMADRIRQLEDQIAEQKDTEPEEEVP